MSHRGPGEAWIPGIHGRTYSGGPQIAAPSMKLHPASHLLGSVLLASAPALAGDLFVDVSLTTGAGTGGSWADAFQGPLGLKDALAVAVAGDRIRAGDHVLVSGFGAGMSWASAVLRWNS